MLFGYCWWQRFFERITSNSTSNRQGRTNRSSDIHNQNRMLCDGDDEDFLSDLNCFNEQRGRPRWIDLAKLSCRVFAFEGFGQLFVTVGRNPRILLRLLAVTTLMLGGGYVGLSSQRDVAIAESKRNASWIATDTSALLHSQFQEVVKPLSAMQQAVTESGYLDSNDYTKSNGKNDVDVRNICNDAKILEKWKSIVEPLNNNNNIGGRIVGYRLYPANITCLVPIEESPASAVYNSKHHVGSRTHNAQDQGQRQVSVGLLSSKFWRFTTRDVFSLEEQPHVNVFGPFSTFPVSNKNNDDNQNADSCSVMNLVQDQSKNKGAIVSNNFAPIDFDSLHDLQGHKIAHAMGFVISFVDKSLQQQTTHTYDRFADQNLQFFITRTEGPDSETGKYVTQTIAFSEKYDLLNENNSVSLSLDVANGKWIIRVGKIQGWSPAWYPYLLTLLLFVSVFTSLAVAMVMVGKSLHQNILDELMSKATTSSQLQDGQTPVEKFHFVTIFSSDIVSITSPLPGNLRSEQMRDTINEIYAEFDKLVEKHEVLKVETLGDTYMIIGGATNRCTEPDAAERVALFALDAIKCAKRFRSQEGDRIDVRAGIASGPVVAGVVGDAKRRYCFSGNTVSYASQMESTSSKNSIQCSDSTYRLLLEAPSYSFSFEQRPREQLDGTARAHINGTSAKAVVSGTAAGGRSKGRKNQKASTTPTWWIKSAESRELTARSSHGSEVNYSEDNSECWYRTGCQDPDLSARPDKGTVLINRITSILLQYAEAVVRKHNGHTKLSSVAKSQLREFVVAIEDTYNENHFHSFFHAYHVIISMEKLVKVLHEEPATRMTKTHFHQDPLNAFALIFSALVHDAGHTGMTNKILLEQRNPLATRYNKDGEPIAERYSLDLAFERLFNNKCDDFLRAIIPTEIDKIKLCQVLFHSVLSTDITSKDRNQFSIKRYQIASDQVFDESILIKEPEICPLASYLKQYFGMVGLPSSALQKYPKEFKTTHSSLQTCVLNEHIMLVSDIAHLMQCWNNFVKWNFRLYKEIKSCHDRGLCDDPTNGWYDGQIWFLVNYVIPLATRFKTYFTSSFGHDLVKQAERNLHQWKIHGGQASKRMADAVIRGDGESKTLAEIYLLPGDS